MNHSLLDITLRVMLMEALRRYLGMHLAWWGLGGALVLAHCVFVTTANKVLTQMFEDIKNTRIFLGALTVMVKGKTPEGPK